MNLCYLVNQYPKVSHTFIRREIRALESLGVAVLRVCARNHPDELVDPQDRDELAKTVSLTQGSFRAVAKASLVSLLRSPSRFLRTTALAFNLARKHDRQFLRYFIYLGEACFLKSICRANDIGHVHAHFATNSTTVALLCQSLGGPGYSFTVHGPEEFDAPIQLSLGKKVEQSKFVVAVSSFGRSQVFRWCPHEQWDKVKQVHCSVDQAFFAQPQPISKPFRLVSIGRLAEQKGQLLLLQALDLLKRRGIEISLTIIGDGPLRKEAEAFIDKNHLRDLVSLPGAQSSAEIANELDRAALMVLPSFAEGLPVVIMESLARARPVLSTYIAGIPELIEEGECGWLIPAGSAQALADKLEEIANFDSEKLYEMGLGGRELVARRHNDVYEAQKLYDLFQSVYPQSNAPKSCSTASGGVASNAFTLASGALVEKQDFPSVAHSVAHHQPTGDINETIECVEHCHSRSQ